MIIFLTYPISPVSSCTVSYQLDLFIYSLHYLLLIVLNLFHILYKHHSLAVITATKKITGSPKKKFLKKMYWKLWFLIVDRQKSNHLKVIQYENTLLAFHKWIKRTNTISDVQIIDFWWLHSKGHGKWLSTNMLCQSLSILQTT